MKRVHERRAYPSDLTDAQWERLQPLIPMPAEDDPNVQYERREILNAIVYMLRSGCPWRMLPHDLPAWQTAYWYFARWKREGIWDQILEALRRGVREKQGRDPEPSAGVIESQSIKTSAVHGSEKGDDAGKKIWGRKRHVLVDSQGQLLAVKVTAASTSDLQGAKALLEPIKALLPRMKLLWGDSHSAGQLIWWVKLQRSWSTQPVRALTVPKRGLLVYEGEQIDSDKRFRPLPRRWVIERSFAWITRLPSSQSRS